MGNQDQNELKIELSLIFFQLSDLAVLEEIIHMMIEILNACLCNNIKENSNIVFALLRDKELFANFKSNPRFQDIVHNIDSVSLDLLILIHG